MVNAHARASAGYASAARPKCAGAVAVSGLVGASVASEVGNSQPPMQPGLETADAKRPSAHGSADLGHELEALADNIEVQAAVGTVVIGVQRCMGRNQRIGRSRPRS